MRGREVIIRNAPGRKGVTRINVPVGYILCLDCLQERLPSPDCLKCGSQQWVEPVTVEQESKP